jgi:hypothetical protein
LSDTAFIALRTDEYSRRADTDRVGGATLPAVACQRSIAELDRPQTRSRAPHDRIGEVVRADARRQDNEKWRKSVA